MSTYKTTSGKSKVIKAKKGKTYYYKVRAYTYDSKGNKVYGPWSTTKAYKIKGTVASAVKSKNTTKTVYITKTGIRYHLNKNFRGLSNANSIYSTSLSKAKSQGYTLCKWEY